jgi:hypothetical protein
MGYSIPFVSILFSSHVCVQISDLRDTLAEAQGEDKRTKSIVPLGGSTAMFVKLVGESWAPSTRSVPDRFGKQAVYVETETIERYQECTWHRARRRENTSEGEEGGTWKCKSSEETVDRIMRGHALYMLDSHAQDAVLNSDGRVRELQKRADKLKGKLEGGKEVLRVMGRQSSIEARHEASVAVSEWEESLQRCLSELQRANQTAVKPPPASNPDDRSYPFTLRVDTHAFDVMNLMTVNHRKWRPTAASRKYGDAAPVGDDDHAYGVPRSEEKRTRRTVGMIVSTLWAQYFVHVHMHIHIHILTHTQVMWMLKIQNRNALPCESITCIYTCIYTYIIHAYKYVHTHI